MNSANSCNSPSPAGEGAGGVSGAPPYIGMIVPAIYAIKNSPSLLGWFVPDEEGARGWISETPSPIEDVCAEDVEDPAEG